MKILLLIVALLMSAFFSGSETTFLSVSSIQAQIWLRRKLSWARWVYYFLSRPDRYLITVLIGNNISIIIFSSLSTYYLQGYINNYLILIFNSVLLLIVGEILPKTLFREAAHKIIRILVIPLMFFRWLFYPLYLFINFIVSIFLNVFGPSDRNLSKLFTKKDLELLLREGAKEGAIEPDESKIISRVFLLSNRRVREVIVPRTEMVTLPGNASIEETKLIFKNSGLSRIPVIGKDLDDIVGVVYIKDLLEKPDEIKTIVRDVMFVPQTILCFELLRKMQNQYFTFAIAIDEYGGTAGLVTLADIAEVLFGEMADEFDERSIRMKKLPGGEILASGRAELHQINEELNWDLPLGNYETLGGLILNLLGRIPNVDEKITIQNYVITVLRADNHRIRFVKILKK